MSAIEYLDRPPPGWFLLDVMRKEARGRDWAALMSISIRTIQIAAGRQQTHTTAGFVSPANIRTGRPLGTLLSK